MPEILLALPGDLLPRLAGLPARLAGQLDRAVTEPLAAAAAAALLVACVPALRRSLAARAAVAALAGLALYRHALAGWLIALALGWLAARALGGVTAPARRWRLANLALVALCAVFLGARIAGWEGPGAPAAAAGGRRLVLYLLDMWLFLRLANLLWEVGSGRTEAPRPALYLAWMAAPWTAFGPLQRFADFAAQVAGPAADSAPWRAAAWWGRLAGALVRIAAGAGLALVQGALLAGPEPPLAAKLAVWLGTGPWGFYLVTSGLFAALERLAEPWGLALPPSFDRPFGRENLARFWAGWNLTVTGLIRDYLFFNRWGLSRPSLYANTLIVFAAVGLWHGAHGYWLTWGLLHGAGFCVFLLWTRRLKPRLPQVPERLRPAAGLAARALTYLFVCACWAAPPQVLAAAGRLLAALVP